MVVSCAGLPDRTLRLFDGARSLASLLQRYGFQDASGCVNHRDAVGHYEDAGAPLPAATLAVPDHLREARGVPQFYPRSGVCWFAALCTTAFGNAGLGRWLCAHMPPELRALAERSLHSREDAEAFRRALWHTYRVGDNVEDPPEMDGRNGFTEFSVLCAKLKVPLLRFEERGGRMVAMGETLHDRDGRSVRAPQPDPAKDHLLVLRYIDGDHRKHPLLRRMMYGGRRYRLLGAYMGQRKCGHQIGMSCPTDDWRDWTLGDADLHKDGIGPIHIRFVGDEWKGDRWWEAWRELVHVTKFGAGRSEFCSLSPHNERNDALDRYRGARKTGSNSIDAVYRVALAPRGGGGGAAAAR